MITETVDIYSGICILFGSVALLYDDGDMVDGMPTRGFCSNLPL